MANLWFRLWHEMPNDPKFRTIARAAGQRIGDVIAVYLHVMVCASNATERGRTLGMVSEDIASALDLQEADVDAILVAMQGRLLDGDMVSGWAKRQPEREDGSAERAKAWREAQKALKTANLNAEQTPSNASERSANAPERKRPLDKDTDKDKEIPSSLRSEGEAREAPPPPAPSPSPNPAPPPTAKQEIDGVPPALLADWVKVRKAKRAGPITATVIAALQREAAKAGITPAEAVTVCCERGWQGFTAEWYLGSGGVAGAKRGPPANEPNWKVNKQEALEQRNHEAAERWASQGELNAE